MSTHVIACVLAIVALTPAGLQAQQRAGYREFTLGASLAATATLAGLPASGSRVIHQRPAVITRLDWRPRASAVSGVKVAANDPVQQVVFAFYDDQLFRISIEYSRERIKGLTDADMIEAVSNEYGPSAAVDATADHSWGWGGDGDVGVPIAQWRLNECVVMLFRARYSAGFSLDVRSPRLSDLAWTAIAEARAVDARDAPQREIERQQKEAAEAQKTEDKARSTNLAAFRP